MTNKAKLESIVLRALVYLAAGITVLALAAILIYILIKGVPALRWDLFAWEYTAENGSLLPALINTVIVTALSLIIAVPLGIFSAIFLVEYAKRGSKLVALVRLTAETLSGIPSIVYGLFGYLMFVNFSASGYSLLAGSLTLAIMILPLIMRTAEEALMSVPDSYREGSFGLGAGKLRTVFKIVLPAAVPGVMSGVILAIGRIVVETSALIFTAFFVAQVPSGLLGSGRTLSVHLYALWNEGLSTDKSYATAVVLLVIVVAINALSARIAKRISKG